MLTIDKLMKSSRVTFGTSGARGLVSDMSDKICYYYCLGFLQYLKKSRQLGKAQSVALAGDLRASTPKILNACTKAIIDFGLEPIFCGYIPSPAIALYGLHEKTPSIMVTGSHIPDDRNGIKFNTKKGEILKSDEKGIRKQSLEAVDLFDDNGEFIHQKNYLPEISFAAETNYKQRFRQCFHSHQFDGLNIGVYQHSSVARDLITKLLKNFGANVIPLARSEQFIPVDTEAIRPQDILLAKEWSEIHHLDAIVSTDGDADRPLIADENGDWLRGDIVGLLCAKYLAIQYIVTPVSSNTTVDLSGYFKQVMRSRIGSPYVIEQMNTLLTQNLQKIGGYEANGGFLQADDIEFGANILPALPTRDAIIVILSVLSEAKQQNISLSQLISQLPDRYTASDRLKEVDSKISQRLINNYQTEENFYRDFAKIIDYPNNRILNLDSTDGLRITMTNQDIIHFRPSGNAPEMRCYTESISVEHSLQLNQACIHQLKQLIENDS